MIKNYLYYKCDSKCTESINRIYTALWRDRCGHFRFVELELMTIAINIPFVLHFNWFLCLLVNIRAEDNRSCGIEYICHSEFMYCFFNFLITQRNELKWNRMTTKLKWNVATFNLRSEHSNRRTNISIVPLAKYWLQWMKCYYERQMI